MMLSPQTNVFVFLPEFSSPSPEPTFPFVFTYVVGTVLIFPLIVNCASTVPIQKNTIKIKISVRIKYLLIIIIKLNSVIER